MISVCILTKNSAETLEKTLASAAPFPEVVLLDTGSTDATLSIAQRFSNVAIYETPFRGFGDLRNEAAKKARHPWIFALDSDEILSPGLPGEIFRLALDPNAVYAFQRHNYYLGQWIKGCGWHPEIVARLYHRDTASFSSAKVHESLLIEGKTLHTLSSPLLHTPYRSKEDFLRKKELYSTLFAQQYQGKRKSSFGKALLHGAYAFFRSYFLKRGILCGKNGFFISSYNAKVTFIKYLKLRELNKKKKINI